nr:MAG TPA: hypothetical protein [Caudoviricetes sp.]
MTNFQLYIIYIVVIYSTANSAVIWNYYFILIS